MSWIARRGPSPRPAGGGKTEVEAVENIKRAITEHLSPSHIQTNDGRLREVEVPVVPAHMDYDLVMMARELTGTDDTEELVQEALQALIQRESAKRLAALGGTEPQLKPELNRLLQTFDALVHPFVVGELAGRPPKQVVHPDFPANPATSAGYR